MIARRLASTLIPGLALGAAVASAGAPAWGGAQDVAPPAPASLSPAGPPPQQALHLAVGELSVA